jgi:preprotein translocase subunit SecE
VSKNVENQVRSESSIGVIVSLLIVVGFLALFYLDPLELNVTLYKVLVLLAGLVIAGFGDRHSTN